MENDCIGNSIKDLKQFTSLQTFSLKNNPFMTHVVLTEQRDNVRLEIENCPNIISIPVNISALTIKSNCKINQILENLPHPNHLSTLELVDCYNVQYLDTKPLFSIRRITLKNSAFERVELSELFNYVEMYLDNCDKLVEIAHANPSAKVNISFDNYHKRVLLPDHVYELYIRLLRSMYPIDKNIYFPKKLKSLKISCIFSDVDFFKYVPESVEMVCMYDCVMIDMSFLPNNLKNLTCMGCLFAKGTLNNLPNGLEECWFQGCEALDIGSFPQSLVSLNVFRSKLEKIKVGNKLIRLSCSKNAITNIDDLPDSILYLNCSFNPIEKIARFPANVQVVDCHLCKLTEICALPDTVKQIDLSYNYLVKVPKRPSFFHNMNYKYAIMLFFVLLWLGKWFSNK